jgi:hypothetical protein
MPMIRFHGFRPYLALVAACLLGHGTVASAQTPQGRPLTYFLQPATDPTPLQNFRHHRDRHRILVSFAPRPDTAASMEQTSAILARRADLEERDLLVYQLYSEADATALHRTSQSISVESARAIYSLYSVKPDDQVAILIGKDGGAKARYALPVDLKKVFDVVDAMPMRQQEMDQRRR